MRPKKFAHVNRVVFLAISLFVALMVGCAGLKPAATAGQYELVLLHTNDHHGSVVAENGTGGLAEQAAFIKTVRESNKNVLLLLAGDINTGSALSSMFQAEPDIRAFNRMGYDAIVFGNHEFDNPLPVLEQQIRWSEFDWISANIKKKDGAYLGKPWIVKEYEGFRVGIFGITTRRTLVLEMYSKEVEFIDEIQAAKQAAAELKKEKVDVIIALTHMGNLRETDSHTTSLDLASAVPEIDLIVDGHSHQLFDILITENGTPIVSAGSYGRYMGQGKLVISRGRMASFEWTPVAIAGGGFKADGDVAAIIAPFAEKADESLREVVMTTAARFPGGQNESRYRETALGNLVADGMMYFVKEKFGIQADFAFLNGGSVRADLPGGAVMKKDVIAVAPFNNTVCAVTLSGEDVEKLFEYIGQIPQGAGGWAQVSKEVRYTITSGNAGQGNKISAVTIGGKAIDRSKTYRVVTNNYLAAGEEGYTMLLNGTDNMDTSTLVCDVLAEYVRTLPQPVSEAGLLDGRITVIGGIR